MEKYMKLLIMLLIVMFMVSGVIAGTLSGKVIPGKLQMTGSISGKITPTGIAGSILARNVQTRKLHSSAGIIQTDGTYKINELAPGIYDLVVIARNCERVFGLSPAPKVNTLTADEVQKITDLIAKLYNSFDTKDARKLVSLMPSKKIEEEKEVLNAWTEIFNDANITTTYKIDYVGGETGKSAYIICRTCQKFKMLKDTDKPDSETLAHCLINLTFVSGEWKIETFDTPLYLHDAQFGGYDYPACISSENYAVFIDPMEGEPGYLDPNKSYEKPEFKLAPWRYSGDPAIVQIKVNPGEENKENDFKLTPVPASAFVDFKYP